MTKASRIQAPVARPTRQARTGHPLAGSSDRVILETQAAFKTVLRSGWRPCRMCLTLNGITLTQGGWPVLEVPTNLIGAARIQRVPFALGRKKEVLCLEYRSPHGRFETSQLWLTGTDIHALREKLADLTAPLELAAIESLLAHLDADAESIVRFLWDRRHATIRELAEHTRMPSDMDILLKIREVINPLAEELLGFPLLAFAPMRHDRFTGGDVLHSWWILVAGGSDRVQRPEIMVDTFDEADCFLILACLPCGEAAEVNVSFSQSEVEISSGEDLKPVRVSLPPGVEPKNCCQAFRNGILELRWDRMSGPAPTIRERKE